MKAQEQINFLHEGRAEELENNTVMAHSQTTKALVPKSNSS